MNLKISLFVAGSALLACSSVAVAAFETTRVDPSVAVQIQGVDEAPEVVSRAAPRYPRQLRVLGVQGFALVDVVIDADGRVRQAAVTEASHTEFGARAAEAAQQWTFAPAKTGGRNVATRVQVPFHFVMPQIAALEDQR